MWYYWICEDHAERGGGGGGTLSVTCSRGAKYAVTPVRCGACMWCCACVCLCVCVHIFMCTCVHTDVVWCVRICVRARGCVCVRICVRSWVCARVCTCVKCIRRWIRKTWSFSHTTLQIEYKTRNRDISDYGISIQHPTLLSRDTAIVNDWGTRFRTKTSCAV